MTVSEVWPNAPLALVALEARFPAPSGGPLRVPVYRAVRDLLGPDWVLEGVKEQRVELAFAPDRLPVQDVKVEDLSRLTIRDRTRAITVRADSVRIEATRYGGYHPSFREFLQRVLEAVEVVLQPDGVTRLGMRYIDEISVPGMANPAAGWAEWVDPSLLAPRSEGLTARTWTSAVQYEIGEDRRLVLRYGPSDSPYVDPSGPMKRLRPSPPGPIFVLDFDSFWQPADIPAFEATELVAACDELRAPVRTLFDQLITERLVNEVFRKEP